MFRSADGDWFVKPICDFFKIDYENQVKRINRDKICQTDTGKKADESVFGDNIPRLTLQDRGFSRWIQIINPSIVAGELREKFELFQANIFQYLWSGSEARLAQLENIRDYAMNINAALILERKVKEYISEQKQHRDLCLMTDPAKWAQIRKTLTEEKKLPELPTALELDTFNLPDNVEDLRKQKRLSQKYIQRGNTMLKYQSRKVQPEENPMPEGFKKESLLLSIKKEQERIEIINNRLRTLTEDKKEVQP